MGGVEVVDLAPWPRPRPGQPAGQRLPLQGPGAHDQAGRRAPPGRCLSPTTRGRRKRRPSDFRKRDPSRHRRVRTLPSHPTLHPRGHDGRPRDLQMRQGQTPAAWDQRGLPMASPRCWRPTGDTLAKAAALIKDVARKAEAYEENPFLIPDMTTSQGHSIDPQDRWLPRPMSYSKFVPFMRNTSPTCEVTRSRRRCNTLRSSDSCPHRC